MSDLPDAMKGFKRHSNEVPFSDLYEQLLQFQASELYQSIKRTDPLPVKVQEEYEMFDIVPQAGKFAMMAINHRRVFRKNPATGLNW